MGTAIEKKPDFSFLLKPGSGVKRGLDIRSFDQNENTILEDKFNELLASKATEIRDEILKELPEKKEVINRVFSRIFGLTVKDVGDRSFAEVILSSMSENDKKSFSRDDMRVLNNILGANSAGIKINHLLNLDLPLRENPIFAKDILRAKNLQYATIIGLNPDNASRLADKEIDFANIGEDVLNQLVEEKVLTNEQKDDLLFTSKLGLLTGENFDLMRVLKTDKINSPLDFIDWEKSDWLKAIQDNKVNIPDGEDSPESYAENIRETIERSFPTKYFLHRVIQKAPADDFLRLSKSVEPLFKNNVKLSFDVNNLTSDEWGSIDTNNQEQIRKDFTELKSLAATYKHLGIGEIVNKESSVDEKQSEISARLGALITFYKNNPFLNLGMTNFTYDLNVKKDNGLQWQDVDPTFKPLIQKQMAAFQRTYIMGQSYDIADKLMKNDFDSAASITSLSEEDFMKESGLEIEKGRKVYKMANDLAIGASHYIQAIKDAVKNIYNDLPVANQHPLVNDLREIDGFDTLFDSLDYCDCEHCRSIFSPAAYFTDLMYFIEQNVSKKVFTGNKINHPLYLKRRRPDLWKLQLSCYNTSTEIPYLSIVNEVLEDYLRQELLLAQDIYPFFKTADYSVNQPFNLALEKLRLYLGHFGVSLYDVYREMQIDGQKLHREKLKLSVEELDIITTKNTGGSRKRFGNHVLNDFNVQEFLAYAGITRQNLEDLLKTSFIPEISKVKIIKKKDNSDIQKQTEVLDDLTADRLDLIHRYVRLWKKTSWKLTEFDLLLMSLKSKGLLNTLDDKDSTGYAGILHLAKLEMIRGSVKLTAEELASITWELPQTPLADQDKSFAERIFDLNKLNDASIPDKTPFLLSGLGITEAELLMLTNLLSIDLAQPINITILSRLYRHTRTARGLKMSIEDLLNALLLIFDKKPLENFEDIEKLISFTDWLKTSPLRISALAFILQGVETTSNNYETDLQAISQKVLEIQKQEEIVNETEASKQLEKKQKVLKDYLQIKFNLTEKQLLDEFLLKLISVDFNSASSKALNTNFTNDIPDNPVDFGELIEVMHQMERYNFLFARLQFKPETITYLINHQVLFGIQNLKALTLTDIKNLCFYGKLIIDNENIEEKLQYILGEFNTNANFGNTETVLSAILKQPTSLVQSVSDNFIFSMPAINALQEFWKITAMCQKLGIQGASLITLLGDNHESARDIALGAFTSKYEDEKTRKEKLEPYIDKINTLKRDFLCDYIISRKDKFKFKDREDLYCFFLLSVDMGGCFRTSKVVAATQSLQLYIHRCLMNLEVSDQYLNPDIVNVKVLPTFIPADEWEWRKNYRVWEANRKVFLYPENYIDPSLRLTRTHLFKEFEEELLQQKITKESAEAAYKKYFSQFVELAKLRYAGAYYHKVFDNGYHEIGKKSGGNGTHWASFIINPIYYLQETDDSCFYLFARTNIQPYQYYYRTYNGNHKVWGNWIKIELGIEAKEISALIHQGKLYIFWTEVKSKEQNNVKEGTSASDGYVFKVHLKYSFLSENGKWSTPQRVFVGQGFDNNENIFKRVRGTDLNPTRWEKEKDSIIESYEAKVFRKPYAFINNSDISKPIGISYLWTGIFVSPIVKYNTVATSVSQPLPNEAFQFYLISFNIPTQTFEIEDGDFSNATKKINIHATLETKVEGVTVKFEQDAEGFLDLEPTGCVFTVTVFNFPFNITVGSSPELQNLPASESTFYLSLSNNLITNEAGENIFDGPAVNKYQKECGNSFLKEDQFFRHIENGTMSMTDNLVTQSTTGSACLLLIDDGYGGLVILSTSLTDELGNVLYAKDLDQFLSLHTQQMTTKKGQQLDFTGPYGEYYWELFFHIPFLIADHFNANQKFREAKWWYERIFNPMADEKPGDSKPSDHNWQFREFRGLTAQKLKDILTDEKAIEVYKKDPFDPHAIARLRISSYQKAIAMKYVDNLIDWGDYLFTQDTRESINEAEMLYQVAYNILGRRPVKTGKCDTVGDHKLTYEEIGPAIKNSEFLITMENYYWTQKEIYIAEVGFVKNSKMLSELSDKNDKNVSLDEVAKQVSIQKTTDLVKEINASVKDLPAVTTAAKAEDTSFKVSYQSIKSKKAMQNGTYSKWLNSDTLQGKNFDGIKFKPNRRSPSFDVVKQCNLVFCVPENKDLMQYWDRIEDRLFKIWNCMNIKGVRRSLALFQPPIDPMLLVRLRASGLSLEEIIALISSETIPNYRFTYLIEKARQFCQSVQGFGSALLSALEKKDGEELTLLRTVHEKNILRMTSQVKKKQVQEAIAQYKSVEEQIKNVENRIEYYNALIDEGLNGWEITQQLSRHTATQFKGFESEYQTLSGIKYLLPQAGSPFSLNYGGKQIADAAGAWANWFGSVASTLEAISASAGLEASFQRREEEWDHLLTLAKQEATQLNQQLAAAEIRQLIAERDLEIHEKNVEQLDELNDFYKNKFTSLGFYNYVASTLNRLYRSAYNIAYDMAKEAEKAYQFERFDTTIFIQNDNWQFDKAGLLAAEKLLQQLQELEKKYIENNVRTPEITQIFSLAMLDASQLLELRQKGSCLIKIPEIAFEILYPGQCRRIIKSVRVTIPCIAGAYTNISAKLTLLKSMVEKEDKAPLEESVIAKNASIVTSSANNDPGMFDFNFRDERYLPFEGAGAISEWRLELPAKLRSFNYDTISDVILHMSYTALDGDALDVEDNIDTMVQEYASTEGLFRLFSLRHEFANSFTLLVSQESQATDLMIEKNHFPYLLSNKELAIDQTKIYLKPKKDNSITVPANMKVNGSDVTWSDADDIALPGSSSSVNKIKGGTVNLNGNPDKKWTIDAGINALNKDQLEDILIMIKYKI